MNSKYGTRTYGKTSKQDRNNVKFEQVLSENKPSTAKVSVTTVHRWGKTTYTSIRKSNLNGEADQKAVSTPVQTKRKRAESPINIIEKSSESPFDFEPPSVRPPSDYEFICSSSAKEAQNEDGNMKEASPVKRNKFFKSRNLFDSLKNGPMFNDDKIKYAVSSNCSQKSELLPRDDTVPNQDCELKTADEKSNHLMKEDKYVETVCDNNGQEFNDVENFKLSNYKISTNDIIKQSSSTNETKDEKNDNDIVLSVGSSSVATSIELSSTGINEKKLDQNVDSNICLSLSQQSELSEISSDTHSEILSSSQESSVKSANNVTKPVKKFFTNRQKKHPNCPSKQSPSKAVFKMKLWEHDDDLPSESKIGSHSQPLSESDSFDHSAMLPALHRHTSEPIIPGRESVTSVHCNRDQKPLYTVVRNVKQAHQCHESGETQEFNDDVDYLIDGLKSYNSPGTRCLSALSLATKCMIPSFRMHLRAHGTVTKLFSALTDAPSDPNVGFCTATLMFVLSQDRLNMDLDSSMLEMMLQLLETNMTNMSATGISMKELEKNIEKAKNVCDQMQQMGHAKHLHLNHITTGELAMETLLSLTSKRAGEWFKEEIRELGGLDHIIHTVKACMSVFGDNVSPVVLDNSILEKLQKISRCFRVLENVTHKNRDNQEHLIQFNDSSLVKSLIRLIRVCDVFFPSNNVSDLDDMSKHAANPGVTLFNVLQSTLRVLVNVTNNNASTSAKVGAFPGIIDLGLRCVLKLPSYVPSDKKFDLCVLSLGMLINLVESSLVNRRLLMETETVLSSFDGDEVKCPAMEALVQLFLEKLEEARQSEEQTDKLLGDTEKQCQASDKSLISSSQQQQQQSGSSANQSNANNIADDIEETLMKALKKAGKHMEHSIVGAYTALLVGFVIQNNSEYTDIVRENLPEGDFKLMADLLRTLFNFMKLTVIAENNGVKTVKQILDVLDAS